MDRIAVCVACKSPNVWLHWISPRVHLILSIAVSNTHRDGHSLDKISVYWRKEFKWSVSIFTQPTGKISCFQLIWMRHNWKITIEFRNKMTSCFLSWWRFFLSSWCLPAPCRSGMLVNSSSSTSSTSLPPASMPYCATLCYLLLGCLKYKAASQVLTIFSVANVLLLLPILILAFCDELQQLQQQQRTTRSSIQSNLFTYLAMLFEFLGVFSWLACLCGILTDNQPLKIVWLYVFTFTMPGQNFCHVLNCLERYLAVRHPIIYRRLKEAKMIRIRYVVVGLIWLLCFCEIGLLSIYDETPIIIILCFLLVNLSLSSFCSISVLCALHRPELKRKVGGRERTDKCKLMAFHTVIVVLGGLLLRYFGHMLILLMILPVHIGMTEQCITAITGFWFAFPISLILPLVFVFRTWKRYKWRNSQQEKQVRRGWSFHPESK